jgi:WD40 repeat protein
MSARRPVDPDHLPPTAVDRIDQICDGFEAAWRAGRRPRIEDHLGGAVGPERSALLRELLLSELEYRRGGGERPDPREYRDRFPADADVVAEVFGGAAASDVGRSTRPRPASARAGSDCNLLFGILAVQMDFVTPDALIAAMGAWVLEKTKPLGRILLDRRAMTEDEYQLLEALVAKHLQKHGGDPARSLAAVDSVSSVRERLGRIDDPELQASLAAVATVRSSDSSDATLTHPVPTSPAPGQRFRVLRRHARGGLGEVFVALDADLHREVALKEIQPHYAHDPESRARFLLEAEVTGGLEHPGVVPVYGLGTYADGRPYYAMRFVKGDSLKEAVARFHRDGSAGQTPGGRALAFRGLLRRFVDVCNAVAYAHSRGVLHRDLKPGNILLGPYGETLVVDWGLAKVVGRSPGSAGAVEPTLRVPSSVGSGTTLPGSMLGTPAYMSPEQAAGRLDALGPASDVYSLGATLYCLLTGRAPFESGELDVMLWAVQRGDFPPPRRVNPEVPPALEAVCLRAMATEPTDRYPSPRALADDVERWLADEPVSAYREGWAQRLARWARRHKTWVAGAAALLGTAVVALAVGTVLTEGARRGEAAARRREAHQRGLAEQARRAEAEARRQAEAELYLSDVTLAGREWRDGDAARVEELLNQCAPEHRHWEWYYLKRLGGAGRLNLVGPHRGVVTAVAYSPDGGRLVSTDWHGTVKVWDTAQGRVALDLDGPAGHTGRVLGAAYSPDGRWVATAGADRTVRVWEAATGKPGPVLRGHETAVTAVAFSPDSARLASAGQDRVVKLWDPVTGKSQLTLRGHGAALVALAFSPDGRYLASAGENPDTAVRLWDAATGAEVRRFSGHAVNVNALAFRPDGRHLASAGNNGMVLIWDVETAKLVGGLVPVRPRMVKAVAYSPDGRLLASGGTDQAVRFWDAVTNREVLTLRGHAAGVTCLAFHPKGRGLAAADEDGVIKIWDPTRGPESVRVPAAHDVLHAGLAISPDGRWVAAATQAYPAAVRAVAQAPGAAVPERAVRLWDAATGAPGPVLRGHGEDVTDVAFGPDGARLAAASARGTVTVWEVPSGRVLQTLRRPAGQAVRPTDQGHVAFGPGTGRLAFADARGVVTVREMTTGRDVLTFPTARPSRLVQAAQVDPTLAFSPDGRHLAAVDLEAVRLWDVAGGKEVATLRGGLGAAGAVAFSPDGRRLAVAVKQRGATGSAGQIKVWDLVTGREAVTFAAAAGGTFALAFTPDGRRLASTGFYHRDVVLWDTDSGRELLALPVGDAGDLGPGGDCHLAFGPDGTRLVLVGLNGVTVWDATPGHEVLTLNVPTDVWGLAYSPDGRRLATADNSHAVSIRDAATGRILLTLVEPDPIHGTTLVDARFSPDGTRLAACVVAASAGWVTLWDATTGRVTGKLTGHSTHVINVVFSPDGRRLATASHDRTVKVWDAESGRELWSLPAQADRVNGVAFSPDGTRLATASRDGAVALWDAATSRALSTPNFHRGSVVGVAFSPDGRFLATAGGRRSDQAEGPPGEVKVWDLTTGRAVSDLPGLTHFVYGVAFSPDGRYLATAGEDRAVRVWEAATGRERLALRGHDETVRRVAFRPDGRYLASAGDDRTVRVWDLTPPPWPFGRAPAGGAAP